MKLICFIAILFLGIVCIAQGATLTVGSAGAQYTSIQDAVDHALPGDLILIGEGHYVTNVEIAAPVTIQGAGRGKTILVPGGSGPVITIPSEGTRIEYLDIVGEGGPGVRITADRVEMKGVRIQGCGIGATLESVSGARITESEIIGTSGYGLLLVGATGNTFTRNTIRTSGDAGLFIDTGSSDNTFYLNSLINTQNAIVESDRNTWTSPGSISYSYGGKSFTGYPGNFWSDYQGSDTDGDGLGDTPYIIEAKKGKGSPNNVPANSKRDTSPLIQVWETYIIPVTLPVTTPVTFPSPTVTSSLPTTTTPPSTATVPTTTTTSPGTSGDSIQPSSGISLDSIVVLFMATLAASAGILFYLYKGADGEAGNQFTRLIVHGLTAGHGVIGGLLLFLSFLTMYLTTEKWSEWGFVQFLLPLGALLGYTGLSSLVLSLGTFRRRILTRLTRIHILVAIPSFVLAFVTDMVLSGEERLTFLSVAFLSLLTVAVTYGQSTRVYSPIPSPSISSDTVLPGSTPLRAETISSGAGTRFPTELQDRYTQVEFAGKGGIARVFKAVRKSDGQAVAVKIPVSFDEATGIAFMKEIRVWEDLRHPNIVEVSAVNILPIPYVEMEYFPRSLDQIEKPMETALAVKIISGVAEGLRYAHQSGVIHRDLKPQNILLAGDMTPKIADWGLSRMLSQETAVSMAGFSLPYASPEQLSPRRFGPTGPWTDLYQMGVILFELVMGTLPFGGEGLYETGSAIISSDPILPSSPKKDVASILPVIMKCLEKEPSMRYQSADEFLRDLTLHVGRKDEAGKPE